MGCLQGILRRLALFCLLGFSVGGDCEGSAAEKYILRTEILHPPRGNVPSIIEIHLQKNVTNPLMVKYNCSIKIDSINAGGENTWDM